MAKDKLPEEHNESEKVPVVLFASSEQQNRDTAYNLLKQAGYKVITCSNGAEAVGLSCRYKFDIIIMDIEMPVIGGWEAAKIIRSQSYNQNTSIVAVAEGKGADEWLKLLESPFDDYIDKPDIKKDLLGEINKYIQKTQELKKIKKSGEITCKIAAEKDYMQEIERLVHELPKWVVKMRETFDKNNLQELQFQIQALKEQAVLEGFDDWAEKATEIERILHVEEIEKINKKIDELVHMCIKTKLPRRSDSD